ncbi:MAG: type II toxin-antitoxin system RelE/ParE family toxin [Candidatus Eremiobacteraeota bacterium]|nr:type II toxin-antitoxin system RelE/ParE family toxin [Candidatus Eremiobacteraeota bacterium]
MKVEIYSGAKRDLRKPEKESALKILEQTLPYIEKNPFCGNELTGDLKGLRSYPVIHKGVHYRILYEILGEITGIIMVSTRENIYKKVKNSISKL